MYLKTLRPEEALGHRLRHHMSDASGHRLLTKGQIITPNEVVLLQSASIRAIPIAVLEEDDIPEDVAADHLGAALCGPGIRCTLAANGRVNLLAQHMGVVHIHVPTLQSINTLDGVAVATVRSQTLIQPQMRVATIKIIPFAVPQWTLEQATRMSQQQRPVIELHPLYRHRVSVLFVGTVTGHERLARRVYPAIEARVVALQSVMYHTSHVESDEMAISNGVLRLCSDGADLVLIAGETSIMDRHDRIPQGIRAAGGTITQYGAPVEPGNLLLLAYLHQNNRIIPIVGAPGCVRSRKQSILDLVLPRLFTRERLTKHDIVALGHGGLL